MPTILIVDDSSEMRDIYSLILKREGYTVLEADDGSTALEILRTQSPDLILSDVMMPALSGFEMAKAIRANPTTQHIPIVILSSLRGESEVELANTIGINRFVALPIAPPELVGLVGSMLAKN
jgi:CheY-like chemotaxis protein